MSEPDPMKQIHEIREKNYYETQHMSAKEYIEHIRQKAIKFHEFKKTIKQPAKDLESFFEELKNKRKAS